MDDNARQHIEQACTRCSMLYANNIDAGDGDGFADLFTEDGTLELGPVHLEGQVAIRKFANAREDGQVSSHVFSNIVINVESADAATGVTYLVLYKGKSAGDKPIMPVPGPAMVGHYEDRFQKTTEGWKIAERRAVVKFLDPAQF
jgi:ketosteroid isomerase-like protein